MPSIADLFITVSSDVGGAISGLTAVETKLNGTSSNMANATAAALPLAAAAAGVGAAFLGAIDEAAGFEKTMSGIKAVMSPAEVEVYGQALEDLALTLGQDTKFSAQEAALAIEELVKAGVPIETIMNGGAAAATSLAAATGFDLARSAEFAGIALNTFHMDATQLTHTVDTLAGVTNASAADMNGLQFAFSAVGPVAASLGISFDDTAIALGAFADNGLRSSDAGTSLKTMLLNLQPTTKSQVAAFQELGLYTVDTDKGMRLLTDSLMGTEAGQRALSKAHSDGVVSFDELFKAAKALNPELVAGKDTSAEYAREMGLTSNAFFDANGNAKSMSEIFEILKVSTADMTNQQKLLALETAFGTDAVRAATIAAEEGAAGFDALAANVAKISAADAAKTRMDNLKGSLDQLGGTFNTLQINIGMMFLPVLTALADMLTGLLNGFMKLPEPVQTIIIAITGVAGAISGLLAAAVLLGPMFTAVAAGFGIMAAAASPFLIPILAITAAVIALYAAWETNFGGIREVTAEVIAAVQPGLENIAKFLGDLWAAIQPVAQALMVNLAPAFEALSVVVGEWLKQLPPAIKALGDFFNAISALWQFLASSDAGVAFGQVLAFIGEQLAKIPALVAAVGDFFGPLVQAAWEVGGRLADAFANFLGFIGNALSGIPNIIAALGDIFGPIITAAWEIGGRLGEAFASFLGFIGESLSNLPAMIANLGDFFGPLITAAWNVGARLGEAFGNFLGFIGTALGDIPAMIAGLGDFFGPLVNAAWEVGTRLGEAIGNFLGFIGTALSNIPEMIGSLGDFFGPFVNAAWELGTRIGDAIQNVLGFIGGAIGGIPDMLGGLGDIFGYVVDAATSLVTRLGEVLGPIAQVVRDIFGMVPEWFSSAFGGGGGGGTGGGGGGGAVPGPTAPGGPIVSVGTLIISSEAEAESFLNMVADAVLASSRRVTAPVAGTNPALP